MTRTIAGNFHLFLAKLASEIEAFGQLAAHLFDGWKMATHQPLEDLSQRYNISRERVRQIENRAFEKVQTKLLEYKKVG